MVIYGKQSKIRNVLARLRASPGIPICSYGTLRLIASPRNAVDRNALGMHGRQKQPLIFRAAKQPARTRIALKEQAAFRRALRSKCAFAVSEQ